MTPDRIPGGARWFLMAAIPAALLLIQPAVLTQSGPPYAPGQALSTFQIAEGFRIEPFAAEPLISSPVAMEIDEHGRVLVVEMPGYPLDVGGSGSIRLLEDTNGDGRPDRSTLFADGLRLPTGIMRWKSGVLVTDSPQVWYLEDADGDGRAEIKREVLTGFALSNPQHNTNAPVYGLDNWIYLANEGVVRSIKYRDLFGDRGGEIRFPDNDAAPRLPPNADGRNVRFRPDSHELEMLSSRSQFGQTFDTWGRHFLVAHNRHIYQEMIAARYLARNPSLVVPTAVEQVPDYSLPAALYPITRNPEFQLLTDVGVMTAASGLTYYLGDLFPPAYRNAAFVAEGAHNVVHVSSVREHGVTFRASRMFADREFLASTDAWFRPVNFSIGPDGALYLIDYYRKILEHPEWMDDATVRRREDLEAGRELGRIYRIVPTNAPPADWLGRVPLGSGSVQDMVGALDHPNIWWRRHAQRLIVDRRPAGAVAAIRRLAAGAGSPAGRVHALWTLEGLGELKPSEIEAALGDSTAGVRENAVRLAELHLRDVPSLRSALLRVADDQSARVRFQGLLTLGDIDSPDAAAARHGLLFDHVEDEWMQTAALSSAFLHSGDLLDLAIERLGREETPGRRALFARLGALSGNSGEPDSSRDLVRRVTTTAAPADGWWRAATMEGMSGGLRADRRRSPELEPEREALTSMLLRPEDPRVRRAGIALLEALGLPESSAAASLLGNAERLAADVAGEPDARADAVRLLALRDVAPHEPLLRTLLSRPEPAPVHIAAVRALAAMPGEAAAGTFIARWDRWTPAVRAEAVQAMVREPARVRVLLEAVSDGRIRVSEIDWPLRVRMMMSDDDGLRARARELFGDSPAAARKAIARYIPAITMSGDANRGRDVFVRTCSTCHQYRGADGTPFGPDLGEVRGRLPEALLTDILHPNGSIADGYELWIAELSDGSTMSGIIASETATSVTFRQAGGGEMTVPRERISGMRIAPVSAMPEGLESSMDLQEMSDLIQFIRSGNR